MQFDEDLAGRTPLIFRSILNWKSICSIVLSLNCQAFALSKKSENELTISKIKHFQIAIENGLYSIYRNKDQVATSARIGNFYILSSYDESAKEEDLGFGSLHVPTDKSERKSLADGEKERRIRGIVPLDKTWFFLDSKQKQFLLWDSEQSLWLRPSDLVLDLIKPPADPRGEATRREVDELRRSFTKSFSRFKQDEEIVGGLAEVPKFWKDRDGSQFLLLLRIPGTPIMTVKCSGKNYNVCRAMRACFVHGLPSHLTEELYGLAVDPIRKEILIGSPSEMRIMRFKAPSCYHIAHIKSEDDISLAEQFKDLSNLFIDQDRNLWITTLRPDFYKNASLFRFDASVWAVEPLSR